MMCAPHKDFEIIGIMKNCKRLLVVEIDEVYTGRAAACGIKFAEQGGEVESLDAPSSIMVVYFITETHS